MVSEANTPAKRRKAAAAPPAPQHDDEPPRDGDGESTDDDDTPFAFALDDDEAATNSSNGDVEEGNSADDDGGGNESGPMDEDDHDDDSLVPDDDNDDDEDDDDDDDDGDDVLDGDAAPGEGRGPRTKGKEKRKPLTSEELEAYQKVEQRRGIIYLSTLPPFMKPIKIRHMFMQYGDVGRVYLQQEESIVRKRRLKFGGNKKRKYTEGWIEFDNKKHAKRVAAMLNNQIMGGKKANYWHDDTWNIKYLPKFKWHHLAERMAYERKVRDDRVRATMSQMKKDNEYYLNNIDQAKMIDGMRKRKQNVATVQRQFYQQPVIE